MQRSHTFVLATVLYASHALPAQSTTYLYSPPSHATTAGDSDQLFPFTLPQIRYAQIHGDLKTTKSSTWKAIAFRRSPRSARMPDAIRRWVDVSVRIGDSNLARYSTSFAANFTTTPTTVLPKSRITLPDIRNHPGSGKLPPFNVAVPFRTTWVHRGTADVCWELAQYAAQVSTVYALDGVRHYNRLGNAHYGKSCRLTGSLLPPRAYITGGATAGELLLNTGVISCRPRSAAAWVLGTKRTSIDFGACTKLYTQPLLVVLGRAKSAGQFLLPSFRTPYRSIYRNLTFQIQGACADPYQRFGIALSHATEAKIPPLPPTPGRIRRLFATTPHTTKGFDPDFGQIAADSLVTRFTR